MTYVYQEYPKMIYGPEAEQVVVNTAEEEKAQKEKWGDSHSETVAKGLKKFQGRFRKKEN